MRSSLPEIVSRNWSATALSAVADTGVAAGTAAAFSGSSTPVDAAVSSATYGRSWPSTHGTSIPSPTNGTGNVVTLLLSLDVGAVELTPRHRSGYACGRPNRHTIISYSIDSLVYTI